MSDYLGTEWQALQRTRVKTTPPLRCSHPEQKHSAKVAQVLTSPRAPHNDWDLSFPLSRLVGEALECFLVEGITSHKSQKRGFWGKAQGRHLGSSSI